MLSFTLFGRVVLAKNGVPLSQFRSQKEAALLIYLAHTGQAHSRAFLAELFWESSSTKQSLNNLRTAVSRLRKQVDEALLVTRQEVGLTAENRQAVDSVLLLQTLAQVARVDTAVQATTLRQALDTYRGEFLADFVLNDAPQFDNWVAQTRAHIHHQVIAAYHKLGQYTLASHTSHDLAQGFDDAHHWLQAGPLNEMAHTLLIRLHLKAGNTPEAIAHYQHFVD
ncbi:MAG: winged helix-turn-helix domain-containing protein, partial [Anaerolineales bacterium]|nr:winged helix-turn-helix domain-containing protein [Anaerolineales bacterium]